MVRKLALMLAIMGSVWLVASAVQAVTTSGAERRMATAHGGR